MILNGSDFNHLKIRKRNFTEVLSFWQKQRQTYGLTIEFVTGKITKMTNLLTGIFALRNITSKVVCGLDV